MRQSNGSCFVADAAWRTDELGFRVALHRIFYGRVVFDGLVRVRIFVQGLAVFTSADDFGRSRFQGLKRLLCRLLCRLLFTKNAVVRVARFPKCHPEWPRWMSISLWRVSMAISRGDATHVAGDKN